MSGRAAVIFCLPMSIALCLAVIPSASAIELVWSTGTKDISVPESAACTLLVRTTLLPESLPREWRVTWAAVGAGPSPIAPQQSQPMMGFAMSVR